MNLGSHNRARKVRTVDGLQAVNGIRDDNKDRRFDGARWY